MNRKINFLFALVFIISFCAVCLAENIKKQETTSVQKPEIKAKVPDEDRKLEVNYKDGKIFISTRGVTVGELFAEIAKQTKITINVDKETAENKIGIYVENKDLRQGIDSILDIIGLRNLAISYKEKEINSKGQKIYQIDKVEIRKRTKEEMVKVTEDEEKEAFERAKKREQEYKELFEGPKKKIAGLLKEFNDPKTTNDRKIKIMTYLRQASVDDPKEKRLLELALIHPDYVELRGAINMAVIHAIADHPDENDKEFLLLLTRNENTKGLLLSAMRFVWDDRFIPELMKLVKDDKLYNLYRSEAAQILAGRKIKEAVPALEEALQQMWGKEDITRVHGALTDLTGMTYKVIDGKAKAFPYEKSKSAPEITSSKTGLVKVTDQGKTIITYQSPKFKSSGFNWSKDGKFYENVDGDTVIIFDPYKNYDTNNIKNSK